MRLLRLVGLLAGANFAVGRVRGPSTAPLVPANVDERSVSQPEGPSRVILLSRGRGGSTVLTMVLAHFANASSRMMSHELFGSNHDRMERKARRLDPTQMMEDWFAKWAKATPQARAIGFKWKPYVQSEAYLKAWDWAAAHNVSVLWTTRNLLNVLISHYKHDVLPAHQPHCQPKDAECIAEHQQVRVTMDTRHLIANLTRAKETYETDLESVLEAKGVRFHKVSFDDLFETNSKSVKHRAALKAWNGAFQFVGLDRVDNYARIIAVADSFHEKTTPQTQCDALENAEAVRRTLQGTEFEGLLAC